MKTTLPTVKNHPEITPAGGARPRLLDLFCGRGGWTRSFIARGWHCTGVDLADLGYPGEFLQADCLTLTPEFLASYDAIVASPPCEEFARAWLPWLRGDHAPADWALRLLDWSIALCTGHPRRACECSNFAARNRPGSVRFESYALWGDVPLLAPIFPRRKTAKTGKNPAARAMIEPALADTVADWFTASLQNDRRQAA